MFRYLFVLLTLFGVNLSAQDTLQLSLHEAKAILLKENLTVLATHYDIDISEAQVIQAKAWTNPYFNWNQDLYSIEQDKYFNYKNQYLVQVDQTFSVAGKYTNTVKLAKINAEKNKLILQDVIRCLMMEVSEKYLSLSMLQQKKVIYQEMLNQYNTLIEASEKEFILGVMSNYEVTRLKSELISLKMQALDNENQSSKMMSELRGLLNLRPNVYLRTTEYQPLNSKDLLLSDLFSLSTEYRPDFKLSATNVLYQQTNLKLQKSLVVPDITASFQPVDKGSNYVRSYQGLELGFALPLFDRNTGNIKAAEFEIQKAELEKRRQENLLLNEVSYCFTMYNKTKEGLYNYTEDFLKNIDQLNNSAALNYRKKNIGLLEFVDLQRIYMQNQLQYIELKEQFFLSMHQLNFSVGTNVIN